LLGGVDYLGPHLYEVSASGYGYSIPYMVGCDNISNKYIQYILLIIPFLRLMDPALILPWQSWKMVSNRI
jgi:hypothetical protein